MQESYIQRLETEAVFLIREAAAECRAVKLFWTTELQLNALKLLAERAFYPEHVPVEYCYAGKTENYKKKNPGAVNQERIFLLQKEEVKPRQQMQDLYNLSTDGKQELVLDPLASWSEEELNIYTGQSVQKKRGREKEILSLLACGGVDDGKSTLIGRLLFEVQTEEEQRNIEKDSRFLRRDRTVDYALLAALGKEEEEEGITTSVSCNRFETEKRIFFMEDTPGHEAYTRDMARGATFAQAAVIMIAANRGIVSQTKRHTRICSFVGIRHYLFAINKMDLADYKQAVFDKISGEIVDFMKAFPNESVRIIPVAAKSGENITSLSEKMPWYQGKCLLASMEEIQLWKEEMDQGFFLPIQRVVKPSQMEGYLVPDRAFQGQSMQGSLSSGDEVTLYPDGDRAKVRSIYKPLGECKKAGAGEALTIVLDRELAGKRGSVLSKAYPLSSGSDFEANILWIGDSRLNAGIWYEMKLGTQMVKARINKIVYLLDVNTGERMQLNYLMKNEIACCEIHTKEPLLFTEFKRSRVLGMFLLTDVQTKNTAALGTIQQEKRKEDMFLLDRKATPLERAQKLGQKPFLIRITGGKQEAIRFAQVLEWSLLQNGLHTAALYQDRMDKMQQRKELELLWQSGLVVLLTGKAQEDETDLEEIFSEDIYLIQDTTNSMEHLSKITGEILRRQNE